VFACVCGCDGYVCVWMIWLRLCAYVCVSGRVGYVCFCGLVG